MKNTFHIKHFDDYHEIRSKTFKSIELGCFPTKDGFGLMQSDVGIFGITQ